MTYFKLGNTVTNKKQIDFKTCIWMCTVFHLIWHESPCFLTPYLKAITGTLNVTRLRQKISLQCKYSDLYLF